METQNFFKSKQFKILLPFIVFLNAIYLFQSGYAFGQWLQSILN